MLFVICVAESWADDEQENKIPKKMLNIVFKVQECDANEVDLCTDVGFIKNKNTHNSPLLLCWVRFTEKMTWKFESGI